jgi:hypothetical protein
MITEARRAFFCMPQGTPRFKFICSSEACWPRKTAPIALPVAVTGVNYDKLAEDTKKFRSPGFSRHPSEVHRLGCEWQGNEPEIVTTAVDDGERATRIARQKLHDLVTVFDPRIAVRKAAQNTNLNGAHQPGGGSIEDHDEAFKPRQNNAGTPGENRTNDFQTLVDSYLEAKRELSEVDFKALPLKLVGEDKTTFNKYFRHIKLGEHSGVMYGGARHIRDYGDGFKLQFFDTINECPINFYASSELVNRYWHAKYLRRILEKLKTDHKYASVFAMGKLEEVLTDAGCRYELKIEDLRHFSLVLGPKTNPGSS